MNRRKRNMRSRRAAGNEGLPAAGLEEFVRAIQHGMAARHRASTGTIPKGQLWQPCDLPGCGRQPVCMNCMKCQDKHCRCFEGEEDDAAARPRKQEG